ncbi:FliM/FliN family flagellar motor switch protein [Methyloversatilis thermotolerans]|uniref:FliM/FliN family flagellar motor switch protein n=1 Tax=Methyloversatilis thermotolerans TaxID=1346290 RepID=UPI0003A62988|nr:FliM/FliN family flagellar motor switch protein [Methyloversatilis thermotolerans]
MNSSGRTGPPVAGDKLEVSALGRPVHKLGAFAQLLRKDMAELLRRGLNKRYRAAFEVESATLTASCERPEGVRWSGFTSAVGRISFAAERPLVLTVLGYRYGLIKTTDPAAKSISAGRETATEERVALSLGEDMCSLIAARVASGDLGRALEDVAQTEFAIAQVQVPPVQAWTLCCTLRDPAMPEPARLWFVFDQGWLEHILQVLAPVRDTKDAAPDPTPFPSRLQMTLTARLLSKDMPLGDLLDMKVGDVIPVFIGAADVLIDESALFSAAVAETKGKLCLTSFQERD